MTFLIDEILPTGIPFIDEGHPLIAETVDTICEDLACKKPLEDILAQLDGLIENIEPYLSAKGQCRSRHACEAQIHVNDIISRLRELRETLENFGAAMPPSVAILELRQWAALHVFRDDASFKSCAKVRTKQ